jgi:acyl-CoA thioester hydrolase
MPQPAPNDRGAYRHFQIIPTHWMDNDVHGHVSNVVYYSYFDTVVNALLIGKGVLDIVKSKVIGLVVETAYNYFSPITFPQQVVAGLRVAHLDKSSVRYEIGLFAEDSRVAAAQGHFVYVYVDRETQQPISLQLPPRQVLENIRA